MGLEKKVTRSMPRNYLKKWKARRPLTICKHGFFDLSHVSPLVFIYLLKEFYSRGKCKATKKFQALEEQVHMVLHNDPQPGRATFVVQCLYVLPIIGVYSEGFSYLIISALSRFLRIEASMGDSLQAKDLAAQLFLDIVGGFVNHDNRIVEKIFEVFDVQLENIEKVMRQNAKNACIYDIAKKFVEQYIINLIESESYMTAVSLLEHFSIRQFGKSFLLSMIRSKQFEAAEKWATFIGKPMLCVLVHEYIDRDMLNNAKEVMQKNNFVQDFPDIYCKYEESLLKKLADKGCWDMAEARTNCNRHLLEYLVSLAMEAGCLEKVDKLCDRYSLKVPEPSLHCVHQDEVLVEDIICVDKVDASNEATCQIEESKVVGLDHEWKVYYAKGGTKNMVCIMPVASGKMEEKVTSRRPRNYLKKWKSQRPLTISKHCFSDLKYISPPVFIYLFKEWYFRGKCKATKKFQALEEWVHLVLQNDPKPGRATFVVQCLYILHIFGLHSEGFSHLIISALGRFPKIETSMGDSLKAKDLAAQFFLDIVNGFVNHDESIVEKIFEVFDVQLANIEKVMHQSEKNDCSFDMAQKFVEQYIFKLIESESYMTAVTLLEHFSIRQFGKSFLLSMIESKQFKAADKWATFIGNPMLCVLVHEYIDRNMLKNAMEVMLKNNFQQEFPDVYHKYKERSLKKLAIKGCWDIAESRTKGNRQLLEYLVYLAMEAGYSEKVHEICDRYSLEGLLNVKVPEPSLCYLRLDELAVEDIIWVDQVDALHNAACHIEEAEVIGLDCEWRPNYEKGGEENKVSIMQLASGKVVFILDLIKLFEDVPDVLDGCLTRIFQSPKILKLGYAFVYDARHLADSYGELNCFNHYQMLLDIQHVFKEQGGGLSGLVQKILGVGLNKTRRNSNWEQRPLTPNQLEYAAIDAAVLLHIFDRVCSHSQTADGERLGKLDWKSCICPRLDNIKKSKKGHQ
ncbi:uncharacterized protein LOC112176163 isoform X2 [Rosa chinensis]|uniref:uncharacterized protein LOC112176163 isoform X2 n=1 Tax=Rosa chinensis TaxID=74649 RepID=UPI000D0923FD|nr:uncharacterized protein LOC112176163 isoform X2 [Rosa chinensis]